MRKFDIQDRIILDDALDSFLHAAKVNAEEAELDGRRLIVTYEYWKMMMKVVQDKIDLMTTQKALSHSNPSTHRSYSGEKIAVIKVQQDLLDDYNFMSRLIEVYEITPEVAIHDEPGDWKLKDGTVLDQDSQDALNDAMGSYTNSSGLTLDEAMERASQNKNK